MKKYFYPSQVINLNCASYFPTPIAVSENMDIFLRELRTDPCLHYFYKIKSYLEKSRKSLASYLSCDHTKIALAKNAVLSANFIINSLISPKEKKSILISDHEYRHFMRYFDDLAKKDFIDLTIFETPTNNLENKDEFLTKFKTYEKDYDVIFFSHALTSTGCVLPANEIVSITKNWGDPLIIIDGAQAVGQIPVNIDDIKCDVYFACLHKWFMSPIGSGFSYISEKASKIIEPQIKTYYSFDFENNSDTFIGPNWQTGFEYQGTLDWTPLCSIPKTVAFRQSIGESNILKTIECNSNKIVEILTHEKANIISPGNKDFRSGITSIALPKEKEYLSIEEKLRKESSIQVAVIQLNKNFNILRVSAAPFLSHEEIEASVVKIARLLR